MDGTAVTGRLGDLVMTDNRTRALAAAALILVAAGSAASAQSMSTNESRGAGLSAKWRQKPGLVTRGPDGKVIFLRKLMPGGSEHSFGIHVAEIAGMPKSIVQRANEILKQLEADNAQVGALEQDGLAATAGNGSANSGSTGTGGSAMGAKAAIKPKASNAPHSIATGR